MITDTGKVAGGKPATGRLCQAGLREKASVRHLARRLTGYRKESSTNSLGNVQGNSKSWAFYQLTRERFEQLQAEQRGKPQPTQTLPAPGSMERLAEQNKSS
jgi:hypothetical protein